MTRFFIACAGIVALLLLSSSPVVADDKALLLELVESGFNALNAKDMAAFEKLHVQDETAVHIDAGEGQIQSGLDRGQKGVPGFHADEHEADEHEKHCSERGRQFGVGSLDLRFPTPNCRPRSEQCFSCSSASCSSAWNPGRSCFWPRSSPRDLSRPSPASM